jgi:hypothetical protein
LYLGSKLLCTCSSSFSGGSVSKRGLREPTERERERKACKDEKLKES